MRIIKSLNTFRKTCRKTSSIVRHRVFICANCILLMLISSMAMADAYRSKIFLDPNIKLDESVSLSIEDLEQQLGSLNNDYAKASAGRHLARYYVQQNQYQKAIDYYQIALQSEGLADLANKEMQQELATVHLLQGQFQQGLSVLLTLQKSLKQPSNRFYILLAQAQYQSGDYLALANSVDRLLKQSDFLSDRQVKQLIAISYGSGDYHRCEILLRLLIDRTPSDIDNWRQLVSIYLLQQKHQPALNILALSKQKKLPFRQQDILLLANLYVTNKATEKGARVIADAIEVGELDLTADNQQRLFEYWLLAREKTKATQALTVAVSLKRDLELYLKLAQLQMEQGLWPEMQNTMLDACAKDLDDRYVGRANLFLGISQLKLGDELNARRSFINARLLGGRGEQANQWLNYIQATPATESELKRISGPCHPQNRNIRYDGNVPASSNTSLNIAQANSAQANNTHVNSEVNEVDVKTVPAHEFYWVSAKVDTKNMISQLRSLITPLTISLVRSGGSIDGPLHLFFDNVENNLASVASGKLTLKAGFPVRGKPRPRARYKISRLQEFKCTYVEFRGAQKDLKQAWEKLYKNTLNAGYKLSGSSRQVLKDNNDAQQFNTELQLGIL
jgi:effector-binding domain-containing protein